MILNKKRSNWASGRGYVPSYSIGFCVAKVVKTGLKGCCWPSTETCCSCIASSRADCVLAGARFTSSANNRSQKMGPGENWKVAECGLEHVDADNVGRHQIGGKLDAVELAADGQRQGPHQQRLGRSRRAFQEHVASRQQRHNGLVQHAVQTDDYLRQLHESLRRSASPHQDP